MPSTLGRDGGVSDEPIYNPLDKNHLAESIVREFFKRPLHPLPPEQSFTGAGIYALYYKGPFPLYRDISASLKSYLTTAKELRKQEPIPIYIGKSDPPGSRKGAIEEESGEDAEAEAEAVLSTRPKHRKLLGRLRQHSKSISKAQNLKLSDFQCRYMLVDEIWVPLGEARLVEWFKPIWNGLIDGFGSNPEGGGRGTTARSVWDILHPGRKEGLGVHVSPGVEARILARLRAATSRKDLYDAIKEHRDARLLYNKARKKATAGENG